MTSELAILPIHLLNIGGFHVIAIAVTLIVTTMYTLASIHQVRAHAKLQ